MADLVLSDGSEITFDLSKVTHKEFVKFWSGRPDSMTPEETKARDDFDNEFVFKITGLTTEQIDELSQLDWRKFNSMFVKVCLSPVEEQEKNSVSASTSPESA